MLRITRQEDDGITWFRLEGKLIGPWVEECRNTVTREAAHPRGIKLDLSDITYVDAEGLSLLLELSGRGFDIKKRSSFVATLMGTETSS